MRSRTKIRQKAYRSGLLAEYLASVFLWMKGYSILERRYKTPAGEIDLIAGRGSVLAFVEVKERATKRAALEALTPRMRRRIERAARFYLSRNVDSGMKTARFDLVTLSPSSFPFFIQHLDNAWYPDA